MKTILIISLGILAIIIFVQARVMKTSNDTEQQEYDVVEDHGDYEIRYYPSATLASIDMKGDYRSSSGSGFRILASYIFGSNSADEKIAMTAPVHMKEADTGYAMSFVMPATYDAGKLPVPDDSRIRIHTSAPAYTATVRFGGYASNKEIERYKQKLKTWLEEKGISYQEPFTFMGYNPPYQVINRRNEVMVRINFSN